MMENPPKHMLNNPSTQFLTDDPTILSDRPMSDGPGPANKVDPAEYIKHGGEPDNIISQNPSILGLTDW